MVQVAQVKPMVQLKYVSIKCVSIEQRSHLNYVPSSVSFTHGVGDPWCGLQWSHLIYVPIA